MSNATMTDRVKTNDIKKGMRILLNNGWKATMYDNKRGNIRMAEVEGIFKEVGSVYAHDIRAAEVDGQWREIELTPAQIKAKAVNNLLF